MTDLFSYSASFCGNGDGHIGAMSEAVVADAIPKVTRLRLLALRTVAMLGAATPLEVCAAANLPRESLQPRLSELRAMGFLHVTGERRRNPSGKTAAELTLTQSGQEVLHGS